MLAARSLIEWYQCALMSGTCPYTAIHSRLPISGRVVASPCLSSVRRFGTTTTTESGTRVPRPLNRCGLDYVWLPIP